MEETEERMAEMRVEGTLREQKTDKDLGTLAVWSVSSAKPGNGVDLLVDTHGDTYWQSDGTQPHLITLQFQQMVHVSKVALQVNYAMDESYTPQRIAVRIGTRWSDVRVVRTEQVLEPQGWIVVPLFQEEGGQRVPYISGRILQVVIISNHQNGRDTHVRQMKVFGPREDVVSTLIQKPDQVSWMTTDATMYATCR